MRNGDNFEAAIAKVRAFLAEDIGQPDMGLAAMDVPEPLRDLVPLARQFGIGDDPAREIAIGMMPDEFVAGAAQQVDAKRAFLDEWLLAGEWTYEKNCFSAMKDAVDYSNDRRRRRSAVPVVVPESVVAGIAEAIEETAKAAAQRHKRQN